MPNTRLYNFDSGLYGINSLSSGNVQELKKIFDGIDYTLQQDATTKYEIIIRGGESLVTNPPGFERKGSLADARSNTIKSYLTTKYPTISNNPRVSTRIAKSIIGVAPYNIGDDKNAKKYKDEQFVEIIFQPFIPRITGDPCLQRYGTSSTRTVDTIPPDGKIWTIPPRFFPDFFSNGTFELSIISFAYPDAVEVEFLDINNRITKIGFIPLFMSDNPFDSKFKENLSDIYKFYKTNPNAITFKYLPLLEANNRADMNAKLKSKYPEYEYLFNRDFPTSDNDTFFYEIIPVFSTANKNNAIIPSGVPVPTINKVLYKNGSGNMVPQQERTIILEKNEEDVSVRLNIYGYRKGTEFDYQTRCKPNSR